MTYESDSTHIPIVDLDQWHVQTNQDGWVPPENVVIQLVGLVKGHPVIADGEKVTTSKIIGKQGALVRTRNTLYRLALQDPKDEATCPDARQQLMAALEDSP